MSKYWKIDEIGPPSFMSIGHDSAPAGRSASQFPPYDPRREGSGEVPPAYLLTAHKAGWG